jgi:hypothetical protein
MALAVLSIDLVAKLASFEKGMSQATRIAEKQADQISRAFARVGAGLAALGGGATVAGMLAFVRATSEGVARLDDLSKSTGASVENLSALENVAARTGVSIDTVAGIMVKFNRVLREADAGTDAADIFKRLGLSVDELKAKDPALALRDVAKELGRFATDGDKARAIMTLFGKSVQEAAPLLEDLATKTNLWVASVTSAEAERAADFSDNIAELAKNATDAARAISGPLVTALNALFSAFKEGGIGDLKRRLDLAGAQGALGGLQRALSAGADQNARDLALLGEPSDRPGLSDAIARAFASRRVENYKRLQDAAAQYAQAVRDASDAEAEIYSNEGRGRAAPRLGGGGGGAARKAGGRPRVAPAGAARSGIDSMLDERTARALRALQSTDTSKLRELTETLDELFAIRSSGVGGGPEVDEAIENVRNEIEKLKPVVAELTVTTQESIQEISTFAEQAQRNIQDALGDTLLRALDGNFKSIGQLWLDLLKRMAAQAAAARLNEYLFGSGKSMDGGIIGGVLKSMFGANPGFGEASWDFTAFGGTRAAGGPIQAGRAYLVGERGPEMIVARGSGSVVPNNHLGGMTYAPTINVNAGVDIATVEALMARERVRFARMVAVG